MWIHQSCKILLLKQFHTSTITDDRSDRAFLTRAYPTMKKNNPHTPILIREALGVEPKIWARYEYGREKMEPLTGMLHPQAFTCAGAVAKCGC